MERKAGTKPSCQKDVFYTLDSVRELLETPLLPYIDPQAATDLFNAESQESDRVDIVLGCSRRISIKGWYKQKPYEGTCVPLAIANGAYNLGIRIDPNYLFTLINYSLLNGGMFIEGVIKQRDLSGEGYPYPFTVTPSEKQLLSCNRSLSEPVRGRQRLKFASKNSKRLDQPQNLTYKFPANLVRHNAEVIKETLDQGKIILSIIDYQAMYLFNAGLHAICIAGYDITREEGKKCMNVGIVDSGLGVLWVTLEHLSAAVQKDQTYAIRPTGALV